MEKLAPRVIRKLQSVETRRNDRDLRVLRWAGLRLQSWSCGSRNYLALAKLPKKSGEKNTGLDETHDVIPDYWISMLFFAVFADNAIRWLDGQDTAYWFWLLSGKGETVAIFGVLSVLNPFFDWFRVGRALTEPD